MTSEPYADETLPGSEAGDEIIAPPARYYRWTRYVISIGLMMGYGSLFLRDGFVTWPAERRRAEELERQGRQPEMKPHTEMDVNINRLIGLTIPPLGLALLVWTLYNSRGRYRLAGSTLYVPGHPPVPLAAIREIDKTLWDRKGIVYIAYELQGRAEADGYALGRLKIDDFVYDRTETDAIVEKIEDTVGPVAEHEIESDGEATERQDAREDAGSIPRAIDEADEP